MVQQVLIGDRLHAIDLGGMRRMLQSWTFGFWGARKWTESEFKDISDHLESIALPSEIHRKLRRLDDLKYWKGTEYSSFLHYAGFVVLKGKISDEQYDHFMLYFCAVTLFSSNAYKCHWNVAGQMMEQFVIDYAKIYGEGYVSSNIHNLLHVHEELVQFGSLYTIAAYPFENALQHMKHLVRSGWKNLEQVRNRLSELELFNAPDEIENFVCYISGHSDNVTLHMKDYKLQNNFRNSWFLSTEYEVIKYCSAARVSSSVKVTGQKLLEREECFVYPYSSANMFICQGNINNLDATTTEFDTCSIFCKLVALPIALNGETKFVPLIHTIKSED
ncbi:uncharacterized protein LOC125772934 isoform X1 [Anopheles funestus]|uniref:uncharacterized protein LOC125772934 isoform X1 n=1 Tax=Anopheles funestus TaxID=62324 RepID=UPI0020C6E434|nr:uncharacterized protein LOC125772934 isoform X1 [Anopheles funestus]XP_049300172.1 uncharacterized protein LOC125772934 isoform X1 [Anopheles funestus]